MRRWIYDFGFFIFSIFSLPHFLERLRQAEDPGRLVRERFGFLSRQSQVSEGARPLWIHCVSVGEVLAVEKFIQLILEKRPKQTLVLTTVTPTGQQMAKRWESERVKVLYFPFDFQFSVRRFFEALRPIALLLVETELWPNVIEEARCREVPVGVINGRISERSFKSFRRFSFLFRPAFTGVDFFLVQTDKDRDRWVSLGVNRDRVKVTGNMKLDSLEANGRWRAERESLREKWGFQVSDQILVGGSTHPGEEEILLRVVGELRKENFSLKLLLAPRHTERSAKILERAKRFGFDTVLASRGTPPWVPTDKDDRAKGEGGHGGPPLQSSFQVLILDQLGELRNLYPLADVVFMGGSLVRHGGQNPVEPASNRRAVIHGPWVFNFEELYRHLDEEGASLRVSSEGELVFVLKRILRSERERKHLGDRAYEVLVGLQGASARNFDWINQKLNLI